MTNDVPMTVRMPEKLYDLVRETALYEDRSMAQVVRRALKNYCTRNEEEER